MAWTNKKGFNLRDTLAFTTDNAGEVCFPGGASQVLLAYPQSATLDGDTFNWGWASGAGTDGTRDRTANTPSSSDHRLAGLHQNGNGSTFTLKLQIGTASGNYKIWLAIGDVGNPTPGVVSFVIRDSNGTLLTKSSLAQLSAANYYDANGTLYTSAANWAATGDTSGTSFSFTTTDTSNGNGGPFIFVDMGDGTHAIPLAHIAIQYLGGGTPAPVATRPIGGLVSPILGPFSNTLFRPITRGILAGQALPVFSGNIPNLNYTQNTGTQTFNASALFTGATSYALAPAPDTGISINSGSGVISVNTATTSVATHGPYIVNATNVNGTTSSNTFTITDSSPVVATYNVSGARVTLSTTGAGATYGVSGPYVTRDNPISKDLH